MIWCISEELRKNPRLNEKLSVVFLEDVITSYSIHYTKLYEAFAAKIYVLGTKSALGFSRR